MVFRILRLDFYKNLKMNTIGSIYMISPESYLSKLRYSFFLSKRRLQQIIRIILINIFLIS